METILNNVVILDLAKYEQLKKAEEKVNTPAEYKHTIYTRGQWFTPNIIQTDDDAIRELALSLQKSIASEDNIRTELNDLIRRLKKMNYWQFRQWKKENQSI